MGWKMHEVRCRRNLSVLMGMRKEMVGAALACMDCNVGVCLGQTETMKGRRFA